MADYINTKAAAKWLSLSPSTLINWRCQGKGPWYYRRGRLILYSPWDLNYWTMKNAPHLPTVNEEPEPLATHEYLTLSRAAELAGVSPSTLQAFRYRGGAPLFYRFDRETYCSRKDFDAWLAARTVHVDPAAPRRP